MSYEKLSRSAYFPMIVKFLRCFKSQITVFAGSIRKIDFSFLVRFLYIIATCTQFRSRKLLKYIIFIRNYFLNKFKKLTGSLSIMKCFLVAHGFRICFSNSSIVSNLTKQYLQKISERQIFRFLLLDFCTEWLLAICFEVEGA